MKMMKVTSVVMLLAMLSLAGSANAELLLNRSFDDLDGGTGNPTSASWGMWSWGSAGAYAVLDGAPDPAHSGPAYTEIWGWAGGSGGFYQAVTPVAGEAYELSIWAYDQGWGDDKNLSVTLHVDDGTGLSLLVNEMLYSGTGLGAGYHQFSVITPVIPAGTIAGEFGITFAGSGTFALDDASMAVVPEPMTLGLLGLGGLFLRRRRA